MQLFLKIGTGTLLKITVSVCLVFTERGFDASLVLGTSQATMSQAISVSTNDVRPACHVIGGCFLVEQVALRTSTLPVALNSVPSGGVPSPDGISA